MTDTASAPSIPLQLGDYVHVENHGDKPVVLTYDSRRFVVDPGKTRPVPFEASNVYFGDPRAGQAVAALRDHVGRVSFVPDRATEVRRLRALYDIRPTRDDAGKDWGDETTLPADAIPNVTVRDLEGNPVSTVIADPEGRNVITSVQTVSETDQLRQLVDRQQQTINLLAQRLGVDPVSGRDVPAAEPEQQDVPIVNGEPPLGEPSLTGEPFNPDATVQLPEDGSG